jgi:DNA invertase Pin-like site-specific DNA recombinase
MEALAVEKAFIDRARSTKDLLNIVEALENKGVHFIKERSWGHLYPSGRLMLTIFAG